MVTQGKRLLVARTGLSEGGGAPGTAAWQELQADGQVTGVALGAAAFVKTEDSLFALDAETGRLERVCRFALRQTCMCACGAVLAMGVDDQVVLFSSRRVLGRFRPRQGARVMRLCPAGPGRVATLDNLNCVHVVGLFDGAERGLLALPNFGRA